MAYIIMNKRFERLCEITAFKSILWHPLYLDPTGGDFQFELAADKYLPFMAKGYYIINTESEKFGIVDTYEVRDTEEDGLVMTVSGLMGESILMRRIIFPTLSMTGKLDDLVAAIIRRNVTEPGNQSRIIPNFAYVSNPAFTERVSKQITGASVADALCSICGQFGHSYVVTFNADYTGFEMRLITGTDRSATQEENPVIVFSAEDFGLSEFVYLTSNKSVFTHVICAGEGYGASRLSVTYPPYSVPSNTGLERREVFLDKKDLSRDQGEDGEMDEDLYLEKLEYEAAEKLQESATSEACEGIIKPYRYRLYKDFAVGDIVTVRNEKLGMEYDIRVLGALISVDENGAQDTTAEMGNLVVVDINDEPEEPEEDVVEEETEEPVIDPATVNLMEDIRPFTFKNSSLTGVDESGNPAAAKGMPTGWVHIFDNQKLEIVLTASPRYCTFGGTVQSLGTITFTLTPQQYTMVGKALLSELEGLMFYAYLETVDGEPSYGPLKLSGASATYSEDENGVGLYTFTVSTSLSLWNPAAAFTLLINGVRVMVLEETTGDIYYSWDATALGYEAGSVTANLRSDVPLTSPTAYPENANVTLEFVGAGGIKTYDKSTNLPPWLSSSNQISMIKAVTFGEGLTTIGSYCCYHLGHMDEPVTIPEGVKSIFDYAFYMCEMMPSVTFPSSLWRIAGHAFHGCTALKTVAFQEGMQTLGTYAFAWSGLESVTLPASCDIINSWAFGQCNNLKTVRLLTTNDDITVGYYAFGNLAEGSKIYVKSEAIAQAILDADAIETDKTEIIVEP